jgi:hypothetical protein
METSSDPHHKEQIGDYVLELPDPRAFWGVRRAGSEEYISQHNTKAEAKAAIAKHQAADKRRRK